MTTMTEPKPKRTRAPGAGRKKGPRDPRKIICSFKGYREFDEWIERLAAHSRLTKSILIEHALIEYARTHGFTEAPPER